MLSTIELEEYVKNEVLSRLGEDADMGDIYFQEGNDCSWPGDYIFTKDGKYHFLSVGDRGGITKDLIFLRKEDILYRVVDLVTWRMASTYSAMGETTKENFEEKFMESRRKGHEKQIELVSLFGEEFRARICQEIEEILERHPYKDVMKPE